MRKDWEVKKLGDVCDIQNGFAFKSSLFKEQGLPILRISNIQNDTITLDNIVYFMISDYNINLDRFKVYPGDIVVALSGATTGKIGINRTDLTFYLNQRVALCRETDAIIKGYLFHYLRTKTIELLSMAGGVAQPNLSTNQIQQLTIPVPPLQVQQQIVEELDCLTSIIEKQKKQLEELDNLAQAIFYDMFGDPIENEKGWSIKKIKDISLSVNYGTSSPSTEDGKYKYLRMNNITAKGTIDLSSIKYINVPPEDLEKYVVRKGDILFNRTNSKELVGKTALYTFEEDMIIAGYIIRLRVIDSIALPIFLSSYLNTSCIKEYFRSIAKGAVNQSNINSKQLLSTSVFIPPLPLQQQFASKIEAIEKQKELIKKSIKETEDLFNSRMDYYFN